MRLAIVSDIHGNLVALDAVLADLRLRAPDAVVNLGDCATSPLWPRETAELLGTLRWPTVRGNHDRWIATAPQDELSRTEIFTRAALTSSQLSALGSLPAAVTPCGGVLAVHGTPGSDVAYLLEEKVDGRLRYVTRDELDRRLADTPAELVLCGHSHVAHTARASAGRLVVNPGSVGCPRYADNADRHLNEAGDCLAHYALATRRGGRWSVELLALDYDFDAVAARARANGRPDWAEGFLR
jgi:predicted phosphodiesterase